MPEMKDQYPNQAYLTVVESGANTLTFNKLLTQVSIYEKVGWIISRIDYYFSLAVANFAAEGDSVSFGLSTSDQISAVSMAQNPVVDWNKVQRNDMGTAGTGIILKWPITKTFADLPGGGLLIPPNPLFIFVTGGALSSAITIYARMFYTVKSLKTEDFWELVELRHMIGG